MAQLPTYNLHFLCLLRPPARGISRLMISVDLAPPVADTTAAGRYSCSGFYIFKSPSCQGLALDLTRRGGWAADSAAVGKEAMEEPVALPQGVAAAVCSSAVGEAGTSRGLNRSEPTQGPKCEARKQHVNVLQALCRMWEHRFSSSRRW